MFLLIVACLSFVYFYKITRLIGCYFLLYIARKPIVQQLVEEERLYVANLEQLVSVSGIDFVLKHSSHVPLSKKTKQKYLLPLRNMMVGIESRSVGNRILGDITGKER